MGIAVKKGNSALAERVDAELKGLIASGDYDKLLRKYNLAMPTPEEIQKSLTE